VEIGCEDCECSRVMKSPKVTVKISGSREQLLVPSVLCDLCGHCPCVVDQEEHMIQRAQGKNNSAKRQDLYYKFSARLGYTRRQKLPACVEIGVRKVYPDPGGNYVGYKSKKSRR
jgi:hypothetical protein